MIILEFESYTENPFAAERFDLTKIFCWRQSLGLVDFLFDFRRSRNPKSRLSNKLMWTFKPSENTFDFKKDYKPGSAESMDRFAAGGGTCRGGMTEGTLGIATGMATLRGTWGAAFFRGRFWGPRRPPPPTGESSVLEVWLSESESSPEITKIMINTNFLLEGCVIFCQSLRTNMTGTAIFGHF